VIRFGWELLWLVFGAALIIVGVTGQAEGGAGNDVFSIVLGIALVGWGYWRVVLSRRRRHPTVPPSRPGSGSVQTSTDRAATGAGYVRESARQVRVPEREDASNGTAQKEGREMQTDEPPMLIWPATSPSDRHFPYQGKEHSLGVVQRNGVTRYVIEDLNGRVVEDFYYASDGWSAAWKTFLQLDPGWKPEESNGDSSTLTGVVATPGSTMEALDERATTEARRITYQIGHEVMTPSGSLVQVLAVEDGIEWMTPDGGTVEPATGNRFCRMRVVFHNRGSRDDIGLIADEFSIELSDGTELLTLEEAYGPDELQGRYKEYVEQGQRIEGWIYYERQSSPAIAKYALFDAGDTEETIGPLIRWKCAVASSSPSTGP